MNNQKLKHYPVAAPHIGNREMAYVLDAVKSGWVSSLGPYIKRFEDAFAKFIGAKYALTTSSGTTALHLALVCSGIKPGDEVIVPDLTFIATANAVQYTGAKPIFVDIDPVTWCIAPESIRKAITPRTKAIIPVHLYGHPAEMGSIMRIARKYDLKVIEDAAEAHGAEYKNKKVGNIGDVGTFSFYGNKIITTGEGGMITTNDREIYETARFFRDQAMSSKKRYWHTAVGFNYRMTNIQAAIGMAQLEKIEKFIDRKRKIFGWYKKYLSGVDGIELNSEQPWAKNIFWMVCLFLGGDFKVSRDQLMVRLSREGIDTRPFFYPNSQMPMYRSRVVNPIAEYVAQRGLNLPSGINLQERDVLWIVRNIKKCLK